MDYTMILWAVIFVIAVLLEAASMQLVTIWFAVGALAAFAVSFFQPFGVQLAVFVIVTGVTLLATRPLVKKLHRPAVPTNHELDIGKEAVVIEDIDNSAGTGRVRLQGVDWRASSADGTIVKSGNIVTVTEISGAHFTVSLKAEKIL